MQKEILGNLGLLLNLHLPYTSTEENSKSVERHWLYEAISNTYLPLLRTLRRLEKEKVSVRLSLVISPTLISMLSSPVAQQQYIEHLEEKLRLIEKENKAFAKGELGLKSTIDYYKKLYEQNLSDFKTLYKRDILSGFAHLHTTGQAELLTTCATHAVLPLFDGYPRLQQFQISLGRETFFRAFGFYPEGFWLPACAYSPQLDSLLKEEGIRYFYSSAHGVLNGSVPSIRGVHAPIQTENGLFVFARDRKVSRAIWSSSHGFSADSKYRDFDRDILTERDQGYFDALKSILVRSGTGLKYYDNGGEWYNSELAREEAKKHAKKFVKNRLEEISTLEDSPDRPPYLIGLYDGEIFGHFWLEGIDFLEQIFREVHDSSLSFITPTEYLAKGEEAQVLAPSFSSWGRDGFMQNWLNGSNRWIYRHLHRNIGQLESILPKFQDCSGLTRRAFSQAIRELLLAQSSDWSLIMFAGPNSHYAEIRIRDHIVNFRTLYDALGGQTKLFNVLVELERRDSLFPFIDEVEYPLNPPSDIEV